MTDHVYLSPDRSRLVDVNAFGKKYQISRAEAVKLGLLETEEKPVQARRVQSKKSQKRRKAE